MKICIKGIDNEIIMENIFISGSTTSFISIIVSSLLQLKNVNKRINIKSDFFIVNIIFFSSQKVDF